MAPKRGQKRPSSLASIVSVAGVPSPAKKKPSRERRTIEQVAQQKIYDNFKGFDAASTDIIRDPLTSLTLRERLVRDLADDSGKLVFGKTYYYDLKTIYASRDSVDKALQSQAPDSTEEIVDPALVKASCLQTLL